MIFKQFIAVLINLFSKKWFISFFASFKLSFFASIVIYPISKVNQWYMDNETYFSIVLGAIFVDYLIGVIKHLYNSTWDWQQNLLKLFIKIIAAFGAMYIFETGVFLLNKTPMYELLKIATRLAVFLYPASSAIDNISKLAGYDFTEKLNDIMKTLRNDKSEENK